jgi:hypothetical protein
LTKENLSLRLHLRRLLECSWEALDVTLEVALVAEELDVGAVDLDLPLLALDDVLVTAEIGEAPVLGDDDLLTAGELGYVSLQVDVL